MPIHTISLPKDLPQQALYKSIREIQDWADRSTGIPALAQEEPKPSKLGDELERKHYKTKLTEPDNPPTREQIAVARFYWAAVKMAFEYVYKNIQEGKTQTFGNGDTVTVAFVKKEEAREPPPVSFVFDYSATPPIDDTGTFLAIDHGAIISKNHNGHPRKRHASPDVFVWRRWNREYG